MNNNKIRIAAVPEHFTLPLHMGIEKKMFEDRGIKAEIIEHPKGTGSMVQSLKEGKVEIAIALTEGLIADKMKRGEEANYKMVGTYVESKLEWASLAHTEADPIKTKNHLKNTTFGISRYGSGSHVMAYVLGNQEGIAMENIKFRVAGGMETLIQGIEKKEYDTFMWEKYTIKPAVDSKRVKMIGTTKTPWPCFCIAIREDVLESIDVQALKEAIIEATTTFKKNEKEALKEICKHCQLNEKDAKEWYKNVEFSKDGALSKQMLENTRNTLIKTGAIPKEKKKEIDVLLSTHSTLCQ